MRSGIKFGAVVRVLAILLTAAWFAIDGVPANAQASPAGTVNRVPMSE